MKTKSETSALRNHYLSSVLPFSDNEPPQITKTKDFFQPDKFIWNNPHRTSPKMYQYYHQQNDQYTERVEPLIKKLEEEDRTKIQNERIHRLLELR